MAYLLSLGDVTHRWGQSRYRERGIPETLSGIPSSVARVLLSQHTRYEHIMKNLQDLESEHEIKNHLSQTKQRTFVTTGDPEKFTRFAPLFLGEPVDNVRFVPSLI